MLARLTVHWLKQQTWRKSGAGAGASCAGAGAGAGTGAASITADTVQLFIRD